MSGFVDAVLNVLTIVALISATAFIIIFLVDLFLSIGNKHGGIFFRNKRGNAEGNSNFEGRPEVAKEPVAQQQTFAEESIRPQVLGANATQEQSWDEEKARREREEIERNASFKLQEEQALEAAREQDLRVQEATRLAENFDEFDSLFAESKQVKTTEAIVADVNFDDIIDEINKESVTKYEESRKVEVIEPIKDMLEADSTSEDEDFGIKFEDDLDDFDSLFEVKEVKTETTENTAEIDDFESLFESKEEKANVVETSEVVETTETVESTTEVTETTTIATEKVTETSTAVIIPADEETVEVVKEIVNVYEYFPLDALNERLEKLQERLKANERDLKANRKEYNPLARVNRSLKRDQEKLRRREAIVARKKVMLYGVNNYIDIDEEKAKKLSEDLDLLDGLRLSVQHCEEVMEQNKDRFPILEKTNQILVDQNKHLKEDIAEVKAAIERLNQE